MNENLRRAVEALETGAAEVRSLSRHSVTRARERLRRALDDAEAHLSCEEADLEPEDVMSSLDRQSREIAEELRRVERLMRQRTGRE